MTARFLAVYETPTDPKAFDRHYRDVHIPIAQRLPGLRRYVVSRDIAAVRGAPTTSSPNLSGTPWRTCAPRSPQRQAVPPPPMPPISNSSPRYEA
jgi:hypothetical protein